MKRFAFLCIVACSLQFCETHRINTTEWTSLFDGKSLNGWKVGKNSGTFTVKNGAIVTQGEMAHLFYDGNIQGHDFKNFEFRAKVMTTPGSNSGIFFHTKYQDGGRVKKGYEVQINNSHKDSSRTGSLYGVEDIKEVLVNDNEWFTVYIMVKGKHVIVKLNERTVTDYTEPENIQRSGRMAQTIISHGMFALQGHDPNSTVYFKDIWVKPLPG